MPSRARTWTELPRIALLATCVACASEPAAQSDAGMHTGGARDSGAPATGSGGRAGSDTGHDASTGTRAMETASGGAHSAEAPDASRGASDARDASLAPDASTPACARCATFGSAVQSATIEPPELDALSGLAMSRKQPDIVFAHDDHDRTTIYALDLQGRLHARIELDGAVASDVEDIAVAPCDAQSCIYLGDIGDNGATRGEYAILRVIEPDVPAEPGDVMMTVAFDRYRFMYEDGSHNAEGLMVAPDGNAYVVTKLASGAGGVVSATGPSSVYRVTPFSSTSVSVAVHVATLSIPKAGEGAASAAAAHPCAPRFLVRTYDRVYELRAPQGAAFEDAFKAVPNALAMPDEPQSEGIDYRPDGRGFVTSGEGLHAPVFVTGCSN
jgi:hypothetical protein